MNSKSTITQLKEMIRLEERRDALHEELSTLARSLSGLKDSIIYEAGEAVAAVRETFTREPKAPRKAPGRRTRSRGGLRDSILQELRTAGPEGARVRDIAEKLGTKPANIHSWFHSTGRTIKGIKKVGEARYTLAGERSQTTSTSTSKPAKSRGPGRPSASGGKGKRTGKRGALSEKVLSSLKTAGDKGISLKDLSARTKTPYKNLSIWFATTGKKNNSIKKLAPGVYKLAA